MTIPELKSEARAIWGEEKLTLSQIIVRLGVSIGDLCRWERNANKDQPKRTETELKKELGNIIFSTIRWCDDLGLDPEECISVAKAAQRKFAQENTRR